MTSRRSSIEAFVAQPALALVGASHSGHKFGNAILRELLTKGVRVYPIHPAAELIDGITCYATFEDIPEQVGGVIVSVKPADAMAVVRDAAAAGIRHVWVQQGAESPALANLCTELGVDAVFGECILMFERPTGFHRAHRMVASLLGRVPRE
jgi:predicted CoA-binding protein